LDRLVNDPIPLGYLMPGRRKESGNKRWGGIMLCSLSKLKDGRLEKIKALEQELGKNLLSFSCYDL
jgi:hypothetical protein